MSDTVQQNLHFEELSRQVAALEAQASALSATHATARTIRIVLISLVVGLLGTSIYSFYSLGKKLQSKPYLDELLQMGQTRLLEQNPLLAEQTQKLVQTASPVLTQAFNDRLKTDMPVFLNSIQSERAQLAENLEKRLQEKLEHHYEALIKKHEQLFPEEFPLVKDKELHTRMMANLQVAVGKLVKKYYINQLEQEFNEMYATWDDFPPADAADKDDTPLEDQVVANLLELLTLKLAHKQTLDAAN